MKEKKVYFPNLNGIRFIAAFMVIIHHIEQIKLILGFESYWNLPFVRYIGNLGVFLFFVLSGFLITYLLLAEEEVYNKINFKKFYLRRILRIWPLYYLIVLLAFAVLPTMDLFALSDNYKEILYSDLTKKVLLFIFFLPNFVLIEYVNFVPYASQTWSVGVEEQFYLIWPFVIRYFKNNRIAIMLFIIIAYVYVSNFLPPTFLPHGYIIKNFCSVFPISSLAIGGILALLLFRKSNLLKFLMRRDLFYFAIVTVIILISQDVHIAYINYEVFSLLFGIVILNFSSNEKIKISLENKVFNYLGGISYGLYMYHGIWIVVVLRISKLMSIQTNWFIYPSVLALTILVADLSYRYYESFFLNLKHKYAVVVSGKEAKNKKEI